MITMGWEVGWGDYSIEIGFIAEIRASLKDGGHKHPFARYEVSQEETIFIQWV